MALTLFLSALAVCRGNVNDITHHVPICTNNVAVCWGDINIAAHPVVVHAGIVNGENMNTGTHPVPVDTRSVQGNISNRSGEFSSSPAV